MKPTLTIQVSGTIAEQFRKEKTVFEKKIGCRVTWTQFFAMRETKKWEALK